MLGARSPRSGSSAFFAARRARLASAGALISGPIAGLASFLVQKMLKNPLDQMAAYEYGVTGSWADPQVVKIEAGQAQPKEKPK